MDVMSCSDDVAETSTNGTCLSAGDMAASDLTVVSADTHSALGSPKSPEKSSDPGSPRSPEYCRDPGSPRNLEHCRDPGSPRSPEHSCDPGSPRSPEHCCDPGSPKSPQHCCDPGSSRSPQHCCDPGSPKSPQHCCDPGSSRSPEYCSDPGNPRNPKHCRDPGSPRSPEHCCDPGSPKSPEQGFTPAARSTAAGGPDTHLWDQSHRHSYRKSSCHIRGRRNSNSNSLCHSNTMGYNAKLSDAVLSPVNKADYNGSFITAGHSCVSGSGCCTVGNDSYSNVCDTGYSADRDASHGEVSEPGYHSSLIDSGYSGVNDGGYGTVSDGGFSIVSDVGCSIVNEAGYCGANDADLGTVSAAGYSTVSDAGYSGVNDAGYSTVSDAGYTSAVSSNLSSSLPSPSSSSSCSPGGLLQAMLEGEPLGGEYDITLFERRVSRDRESGLAYHGPLSPGLTVNSPLTSLTSSVLPADLVSLSPQHLPSSSPLPVTPALVNDPLLCSYSRVRGRGGSGVLEDTSLLDDLLGRMADGDDGGPSTFTVSSPKESGMLETPMDLSLSLPDQLTGASDPVDLSVSLPEQMSGMSDTSVDLSVSVPDHASAMSDVCVGMSVSQPDQPLGVSEAPSTDLSFPLPGIHTSPQPATQLASVLTSTLGPRGGRQWQGTCSGDSSGPDSDCESLTHSPPPVSGLSRILSLPSRGTLKETSGGRPRVSRHTRTRPTTVPHGTKGAGSVGHKKEEKTQAPSHDLDFYLCRRRDSREGKCGEGKWQEEEGEGDDVGRDVAPPALPDELLDFAMQYCPSLLHCPPAVSDALPSPETGSLTTSWPGAARCPLVPPSYHDTHTASNGLDSTQQSSSPQLSQLACDELSPSATGELSPLATGELPPSANGELSPLATGELSPLATGELSSLVTGELSPLAAGELSPLAAGELSAVCDKEELWCKQQDYEGTAQADPSQSLRSVSPARRPSLCRLGRSSSTDVSLHSSSPDVIQFTSDVIRSSPCVARSPDVQPAPPNDAQSLSSDVIKCLSSDDLASLSPDIIQSLSSDIMKCMTSDVMKLLSSDLIKPLTSDLTKSFSSDVRKCTPSDVMKSFSSAVVKPLSPDIIKCLSADVKKTPLADDVEPQRPKLTKAVSTDITEEPSPHANPHPPSPDVIQSSVISSSTRQEAAPAVVRVKLRAGTAGGLTGVVIKPLGARAALLLRCPAPKSTCLPSPALSDHGYSTPSPSPSPARQTGSVRSDSPDTEARATSPTTPTTTTTSSDNKSKCRCDSSSEEPCAKRVCREWDRGERERERETETGEMEKETERKEMETERREMGTERRERKKEKGKREVGRWEKDNGTKQGPTLLQSLFRSLPAPPRSHLPPSPLTSPSLSSSPSSSLTPSPIRGNNSTSSICDTQTPSPTSPPAPVPANGGGKPLTAMSELEKHLRGLVAPPDERHKEDVVTSPVDGVVTLPGSKSLLEMLLTGELSDERYRQIDYQLLYQERERRLTQARLAS